MTNDELIKHQEYIKEQLIKSYEYSEYIAESMDPEYKRMKELKKNRNKKIDELLKDE